MVKRHREKKWDHVVDRYWRVALNKRNGFFLPLTISYLNRRHKR